MKIDSFNGNVLYPNHLKCLQKLSFGITVVTSEIDVLKYDKNINIDKYITKYVSKRDNRKHEA